MVFYKFKTRRDLMRQLSLALLFLSFSAFSGESARIPITTKVTEHINFKDDLDFHNMKLAIKRNMAYFNRADLGVSFKFGKDSYTRKDLKLTLMSFEILVDQAIECLKEQQKSVCYDQFSKTVNNEFNAYRPSPLSWERGYNTNQSLFTAYYSPDFKGSRVKTDVYKHAIYNMPKDAKLRSLSRVEIDFDNKLAGKGLEIAYVKESLYDIWLLHVEGGGRITILNEDGTSEVSYLSYAGSNKKTFKMLYHYMLDSGMLKPGQASIDQQRAYLEANPEDQREVFASSPSYIFFKESKKEPLGVKNVVLTENRSLASDYRIYKEYGILNFIQAKRPMRVNGKVKMVNFSRFFINQDTGGAIKGNARSDLYFGFGREAELTANNLKVLGDQFFLIKKN
jgi:membrane-bound lytic murein transglycosylase A